MRVVVERPLLEELGERLVGGRLEQEPLGEAKGVGDQRLLRLARIAGLGVEDEGGLLRPLNDADIGGDVQMHAARSRPCCIGSCGPLCRNSGNRARRGWTCRAGIERNLRIDFGGQRQLRHHIDVELVVGGVPGDGRADREAALGVEFLDQAVKRTVLAIDPLIDGVIVIDRTLIVRRAELDADGDVREHHVERSVVRDLPQEAVRVVHVRTSVRALCGHPG